MIQKMVTYIPTGGKYHYPTRFEELDPKGNPNPRRPEDDKDYLVSYEEIDDAELARIKFEQERAEAAKKYGLVAPQVPVTQPAFQVPGTAAPDPAATVDAPAPAAPAAELPPELDPLTGKTTTKRNVKGGYHRKSHRERDYPKELRADGSALRQGVPARHDSSRVAPGGPRVSQRNRGVGNHPHAHGHHR